jgi:hypothetical protein
MHCVKHSNLIITEFLGDCEKKKYWGSGFDHILIFRKEQISATESESIFRRNVEVTCCVASG